MRTSERFLLRGVAAAAAIAAAFGAAPALAFDGVEQPQQRVAPADVFPSVRDALRDGVRNLNAGNKGDAVKAFRFAADGGNTAAQYKLGRMYADGDGVPHDDFKAFQYFSAIANRGNDDGPDSPTAGATAKAFVALGSYFLDGIPNSPIKANAPRAQEFFQYAATYFGDMDAQYNLARLYLDGALGARDPRMAVRWLDLAAKKGHVAARAVLGRLLFTGDGVPRQGPLGLMWLSLANDGADPAKDGWVGEIYQKAFGAASEDERKLSERFMRQRQPRAELSQE